MESEETLMNALGIEITSLDQNLVEMTMPVDDRTRQPVGYLHGGASVALAETAASVGATLQVDLEQYLVFGLEINANHIKSKRDGTVTARAVPFHVGRTTQVWDIKITDEKEQLICVSRCTIGVVPKSK
ncbi:1,4-dihydroxy-2-naphthoyl-CoA hydrolase [Lentibacillus sp. JNUCC-1]|uniref:hotdog fold thioesterase n=1 Tax=Lentibacillus sp. JNUCC-1 TaxID=2654513 RepID=UPI0012E76655|nr:hotdog fold thioesterase [Lentibacillus sp. JNUCC-1]MUV39244.1 1,4-dihydroxy-2-naphthoyl-CoA hydrolase [Lentibacillus sp. JNUCC-1]